MSKFLILKDEKLMYPHLWKNSSGELEARTFDDVYGICQTSFPLWNTVDYKEAAAVADACNGRLIEFKEVGTYDMVYPQWLIYVLMIIALVMVILFWVAMLLYKNYGVALALIIGVDMLRSILNGMTNRIKFD